MQRGFKILALLVPLAFFISAGEMQISKPIIKPVPKVGIQQKIPAAAIPNKKLETRYAGKQVFIVSDKEWKDVLGLVSVANWGTGEIMRTNPVLIYHDEDSGFDADAIIHFVEQYDPAGIVLVGSTPSDFDNLLISRGYIFASEEPVPAKWITRISRNDYVQYWESSNVVIICEDNYQLGLLASVYAAYRNAPLFFEGQIPAGLNLEGKDIITVGATSYAGSESHTLATLERKLAEDHPTDKLLLVNYNDLNIEETKIPYTPFRTTLTRSSISHLFSKTSLSAPFLAAGKQELLLTNSATASGDVKDYLDATISRLGLRPKYLTIMASPPAIQMEERTGATDPEHEYFEVDNRIYGDRDGDGVPDIAVGRIFSLTPSDVSANVARSLFFEDIPKSDDHSILYNGESQLCELKCFSKSLERTLNDAGLAVNSVYTDESITRFDLNRDLSNKLIIAYSDHANILGWNGDISTSTLGLTQFKFAPSIVISNGCKTCAYTYMTRDMLGPWHPKDLFCPNVIRHGALVHIGLVRAGYAVNDFVGIITKELLRGSDAGQAFLKYNQIVGVSSKIKQLQFGEGTGYVSDIVLLGDPTINIVPAAPLTDDVSINEETLSSTKKILRIRVNQPAGEIPCYPTFSNCMHELPESPSYISGLKCFHPDRPSGYNFKDVFLFEGNMQGIISGFSIIYSDGSEKSYTLTQENGLYYGRTTECPTCRQIILSPINSISGRNYIYLSFNSEGEDVELSDLVPSYEYEIEFETLSPSSLIPPLPKQETIKIKPPGRMIPLP